MGGAASSYIPPKPTHAMGAYCEEDILRSLLNSTLTDIEKLLKLYDAYLPTDAHRVWERQQVQLKLCPLPDKYNCKLHNGNVWYCNRETKVADTRLPEEIARLLAPNETHRHPMSVTFESSDEVQGLLGNLNQLLRGHKGLAAVATGIEMGKMYFDENTCPKWAHLLALKDGNKTKEYMDWAKEDFILQTGYSVVKEGHPNHTARYTRSSCSYTPFHSTCSPKTEPTWTSQSLQT